jgi:hypothetical protein
MNGLEKYAGLIAESLPEIRLESLGLDPDGCRFAVHLGGAGDFGYN